MTISFFFIGRISYIIFPGRTLKLLITLRKVPQKANILNYLMFYTLNTYITLSNCLLAKNYKNN